MLTLDNFYQSKKWVGLIGTLRAERVGSDGVLRCAHCGKPIIKAYDCIGHHKVELTPANVNDYSISLNPDNILLVHHKCHNMIHERFGHERAKEVWLVYGAPCSGKRAFVESVAGRDDLVLDMDSIWQMVSINDRYIKPNRLKTNVFMIRECMFDMIRMRTGRWKRAYIIGGYPFAMDRERLIQSMRCKTVFIDETKETCLQRAKESGRTGYDRFIEDWFRDYSE